MNRALRIDARDNAAVALASLQKGTQVRIEDAGVTLLEDIAPGHKFSLFPIQCGETVYKYGFPIGRASADIPAGAWVHSHNLRSALDGESSYSYTPVTAPAVSVPAAGAFSGFDRPSGAAGIRNEIWIIPSVGCVN